MTRTVEVVCGLAFLLTLQQMSFGQSDVYNSGGPLMPEQAAYDVTFYELDLFVNPDDSTIKGSLRVDADVVSPLQWFVLDLDPKLKVDKVASVNTYENNTSFKFERKSGKLWILLPQNKIPGERVSLKVFYGGKPLVAKTTSDSWDDGFTWTKSKHGEPWLGIVCVLNGADIWWPCKDHPSDEADSMALHIKVPEPLTVVSNGSLRHYERLGGRPRMHKFHWFVSTPINNYSVTLNIAQYSKLEDTYPSISGEKVPVVFWVMPEYYSKAIGFFPQIKKHLRFLETILGPYPFRTDKYAIAQTVYSGMEHQTIISYGGNFRNNKYGFEALHFHELTHEWFANMVTAPDWKDWWLHEGISSYLEAIYAESLHGIDAYHDYIARFRQKIQNSKAVAPEASQRTRDIYGVDLYYKAAWVLHSLRYLIGEEALLKSFRLLAYPDPALENVTDGRQCHFATTADYEEIVEKISGQDLEWFFDVYLRQPELPSLVDDLQGNTLKLKWETPDNLPFKMPVEVRFASELHKVDMSTGIAYIDLPKGASYVIDPKNWLLKKDLQQTTQKVN